MTTDFQLQTSNNLSSIFAEKGLFTWAQLTDFVKHLPYGRNSNRTDFSLVITENKGSCSSKHAFLKHAADLNNLPNIKLILGIYKMNALNTPKIGNVLIDNNLDYMPEAHCYLSVAGVYEDYTSRHANFNHIKNDILLEQEIESYQVIEFKVDYHKAFIRSWIENENIPFNFDETWKIREECISNMST